jgi:hypothetical protein
MGRTEMGSTGKEQEGREECDGVTERVVRVMTIAASSLECTVVRVRQSGEYGLGGVRVIDTGQVQVCVDGTLARISRALLRRACAVVNIQNCHLSRLSLSL